MKLRILRKKVGVPAPQYGENMSIERTQDVLQYLPKVWIGDDQFDADEWIDVPIVEEE